MPDEEAAPAVEAAEAAAEAAADAAGAAREAVAEVIDEGEDLIAQISDATAGNVERAIKDALAPVIDQLDQLGQLAAKIASVVEAPAARVREELPTITQTPTADEPILVAPKRRHWFTRLPRGL